MTALWVGGTEEGLRSAAVRGVMDRRARFENRLPDGPAANDLRSVLSSLRDRGVLFIARDGARISLNYVPSVEARQTIFDEPGAAGWNEKIVKRQRKAFRSTEGAVFRLPVVDHEGHVECFITDWSPFPAAAAIAVHADYPLVRDRAGASGFTGRFVRHPLTGDLLPVWVGAWVKPEFGTGAVIVNPAHSAADLAFAREVGLPIRFALVPVPVTNDPSTWPSPPVIRQGTTTRTGRFDGLTPADAVNAYFAALSEQGFARRHTDLGIGLLPAAAIESAGADLSVDAVLRGETPAGLRPMPWIEALIALGAPETTDLIAPAAESTQALLFLRMAYFDLHQRPLAARTVRLVQDPTVSAEIDPQIGGLASLFVSALDESGAVKNQHIDQAQTFYTRHQELVAKTGQPGAADAPPKEASRIKNEIMAWDLRNAALNLYAWQKEMSKGPDLAEQHLIRYAALAYVLSGARGPAEESLAAAWQQT